MGLACLKRSGIEGGVCLVSLGPRLFDPEVVKSFARLCVHISAKNFARTRGLVTGNSLSSELHLFARFRALATDAGRNVCHSPKIASQLWSSSCPWNGVVQQIRDDCVGSFVRRWHEPSPPRVAQRRRLRIAHATTSSLVLPDSSGTSIATQTVAPPRSQPSSSPPFVRPYCPSRLRM